MPRIGFIAGERGRESTRRAQGGAVRISLPALWARLYFPAINKHIARARKQGEGGGGALLRRSSFAASYNG